MASLKSGNDCDDNSYATVTKSQIEVYWKFVKEIFLQD